MKKLGYDDLFHLYLMIEFTDNETYVLEKNQRVNFQKKRFNNDEKLGPFPVRISLRKFFDNVSKYTNNWHSIAGYDPGGNSCQVFVKTILTANNLYTPERKAFTEQDLASVMKGNPKTKAIVAGVITAVGSLEHVIEEGNAELQNVGEFRGNRFGSSRFDNFSRLG